MNIALAGSTLAYGFLLERVVFPLNYQIMFVVAFVFSLISFLQVMQARALYLEQNPQTENDTPSPRRLSYRQLWRTPECWAIVFVVFITHLAFFSVQPMIQIHIVNNLGATEEFIAWFGLIELMAAAVAGLFADRILARIGARNLIAAAISATGVAVFIVGHAPSLAVTLLPAAISGAAWTTASVAFFGFLMDRTPVHNMQSMTMIFNQVIGLGQFSGSIFGSALANTGLYLGAVLTFGGVLRVGSALAALNAQRLPRFFSSRLKRRSLAVQLGGD